MSFFFSAVRITEGGGVQGKQADLYMVGSSYTADRVGLRYGGRLQEENFSFLQKIVLTRTDVCPARKV